MENRTILDIGSILSDFNKEAASRYGRRFQDNITKQYDQKKQDAQVPESEDKEPIEDFDDAYRESCHILENIKKKWGSDNTGENLSNIYYQRDLLYLYDRLTLDMNYLNAYPDRNSEWLEKLLELKYEIRNML